MARVRGVVAVLGVALCAALSSVAPAAAATGSISGTVTEAGGGRIEGIWVCASTPSFGLSGDCEQTDADGKYEMDGLEPSFYKVAFEEEGRQNYLAQWYPAKPIVEQAGAVEVKSGEEAAGIDAELQPGGQITGTVSDVEGGAPVEGIEVCAPQIDRVTEFGVIHCDKSDSAGEYTIQALPTGLYKVEFFVRKSPNYIGQYYPGKASFAEATQIAVTAGAPPIPFIDAVMQRGIQISGTVTEAGGSGLTWESRVCAHNAATEAVIQCDFPEKDGTYSIAGLPFGAYVVSFAIDVEEEPGLILHPDGFVRQYYNAKPTFAAADRLTAAGPAEFTGIDAQLVRGPEVFPNKPPPPVVVTLIERPAPKPLHCKRGFRKKFVRGKQRCVKVHKRHHHHRHGHGPHAVATGR